VRPKPREGIGGWAKNDDTDSWMLINESFADIEMTLGRLGLGYTRDRYRLFVFGKKPDRGQLILLPSYSNREMGKDALLNGCGAGNSPSSSATSTSAFARLYDATTMACRYVSDGRWL
jgi:hypothetical protein